MEREQLARAFAAVAAAYERGRPAYPEAAVAALGLGPGKAVVDVGAGTGKLTRLLAATGAHVVAVEPLDEMRAFIRDVPALAGTAEALPLPDASADVVAAGQAFHWFRADAALAEAHRVLRPGGRLLLLWNRLDRSDPFTDAFAGLLERHRAHASLETEPLDPTPLFEPFRRAEHPYVQAVDGETLAARIASESSIAVLPPERRERALEEARALASRGAELRYRTRAYSTRRA